MVRLIVSQQGRMHPHSSLKRDDQVSKTFRAQNARGSINSPIGGKPSRRGNMGMISKIGYVVATIAAWAAVVVVGAIASKGLVWVVLWIFG